MVFPAKQVTRIRCRVTPTMNLFNNMVLFEADEGNRALEQLDVFTGSLKIQN